MAALAPYLVALLTHFGSRAEPLLGRLRRLQHDAAAARLLSTRHQAEKAEWERERSSLMHTQNMLGRRTSMRRPSSHRYSQQKRWWRMA